jgi:hypothetical protein
MRLSRARTAVLATGAAVLIGVLAASGSSAASPPRSRVTPPVTRPVTRPVTPPLRVAVVGDSIGWGQGLADHHKYARLVSDWLGQRTGRAVSVDMYAHSGATLTGPCAPVLPVGEVPSSTPSVGCQLTAAAAAGHGYDLVLLSGCINDVSVQNLILGTTPVRKAVRATCAAPLKAAVRTALALPGHPKVVVTGYYQMVSEKTSKQAFAAALAAGLGTGTSPGTGTGATAEAVWRNAVRRTGEFDAAFDEIAEAAVSRTEGSATFVSPDYARGDALFAPHTLLWTGTNDEVLLQRGQVCDSPALGLPTATKQLCKLASIGHPNVKGAARYATGIESAIGSWFEAARSGGRSRH